MLNASQLVGTHDVLFVTLDTLRYNVAAHLHATGRTPNLSALLPNGWEKRREELAELKRKRVELESQFVPTMITKAVEPREIRILPRSGKAGMPSRPITPMSGLICLLPPAHRSPEHI